MQLKVIIGGILVLGLLAVVVLFGDSETIETISDNRQGNTDSSVVFTEALDFGCPACASLHPLIERYRQEHGDKIIFEARHFPIISIHPNSLAAHRAAEAAARQAKFWEMHDILFEQRELWVSTTTSNPVPQLEVFAEELGLDMDKFRQDYASAEINSIINNDIKLMKDMGVHQTPTFFLNSELVDRLTVSDGDAFRELIEETLGENPDSDPDADHGHEDGEADHSHDDGAADHSR